MNNCDNWGIRPSFQCIGAFVGRLAFAAVLAAAPVSFARADDQDEPVANFPVSKNQMVKLTDQGVVPSTLKMTKAESIAFYYNATNDSLATVEINFNGKHTHCASSNLKIGTDGVVRSIRPFGPGDFATTCFHDAGTYDLTVYGLKANPKGIKATIIVE